MSAFTVIGVAPLPILEVKVLNMLSSQENFLTSRLILNLRAGNTMESSYIALSSTQSATERKRRKIFMGQQFANSFPSLRFSSKTEPANIFGSSPHPKDTYSNIGWSEVMTFPFI